MSASFVLSFLLIVSPPTQSAQDSTKIEALEERVAELKVEMGKQKVSRKYFEGILGNQRWTFGIGITLVTVLFGLIGWGIFEWRAGKIEKQVDRKFDDFRSDMRDNIGEAVDPLERKLSSLREILRDQQGITDLLRKDLDKLNVKYDMDRLKYINQNIDDINYIKQGIVTLGKIIRLSKEGSIGIMESNFLIMLSSNLKDKFRQIDTIEPDEYESIISVFESVNEKLEKYDTEYMDNILSDFRSNVVVD